MSMHELLCLNTATDVEKTNDNMQAALFLKKKQDAPAEIYTMKKVLRVSRNMRERSYYNQKRANKISTGVKELEKNIRLRQKKQHPSPPAQIQILSFSKHSSISFFFL